MKLQDRLVVERDGVKFAIRYAGFRETVSHRIYGEGGIMLFTGETLLLRGGNDLAINQQAGGRVMVVGTDSQYSITQNCFLREPLEIPAGSRCTQ